MRCTLILLSTLLILTCPSPAPAGPKEDVAAATQAWIDAVNSRDPERVVVLYDPEAVLWGTVSPAIRDSPSAIRDYFKTLPTFPPEYKGVIGEQRVRIYGDTAINSGTYTLLERRRPGRQANQHRGAVQLCLPESGRALVNHRSSLVGCAGSTPVMAPG